jgi:hypothetical protein
VLPAASHGGGGGMAGVVVAVVDDGCGAQGRQGTWNRRVRGCAPQAAPRNFRVFEGAYTRPATPHARPPEASSAGPPEAYIFLGGSCDKEEPPVVTEIGAGCTSGACSLVQFLIYLFLVQNTAFPGRACSRKGGSSGGQGRQPAPEEPQGPQGWNCRVQSGTAGGGVVRNALIAVLESLAIWNSRALTPLSCGGAEHDTCGGACAAPLQRSEERSTTRGGGGGGARSLKKKRRKKIAKKIRDNV